MYEHEPNWSKVKVRGSRYPKLVSSGGGWKTVTAEEVLGEHTNIWPSDVREVLDWRRRSAPKSAAASRSSSSSSAAASKSSSSSSAAAAPQSLRIRVDAALTPQELANQRRAMAIIDRAAAARKKRKAVVDVPMASKKMKGTSEHPIELSGDEESDDEVVFLYDRNNK